MAFGSPINQEHRGWWRATGLGRDLVLTCSAMLVWACSSPLVSNTGTYVPGVSGPDAGSDAAPGSQSVDPQASIEVGVNDSCFGGQNRPARIALVVDNSGSNNSTPGVLQTPGPGEFYEGTDAIRNSPSIAQDSGEGYTFRQLSLYTLISSLSELNGTLLKKYSSWPGIEIGIASFPKSFSDLSGLDLISGQSQALPELMTNLNTTAQTTEILPILWNDLRFTHFPEGMTPYHTALRNGRELLKSTRASDDDRKDVIVLITDGLPTDQNPESILALRESMPDTEVHLVSIYKKLTKEEEDASDLKRSLRQLYEDDDYQWGREYFASFDEYWAALQSVPDAIATQSYRIPSANELHGVLDTIARDILDCSP
jgi:hypothetical protein